MNFETKKVLGLIKGALVGSIDGKVFASGAEAIEWLQDKYVVTSISAKGGAVKISLEADNTIPNDMNDEWIKEHVVQFGKKPNLFDGM